MSADSLPFLDSTVVGQEKQTEISGLGTYTLAHLNILKEKKQKTKKQNIIESQTVLLFQLPWVQDQTWHVRHFL